VTGASPIAAIICEGPCNGRYRRAEAAYKAALASYDQALLASLSGGEPPPKPEKHDVVPYTGDPVWCLRDQSLIRTALDELDDLACRVDRESAHMRSPVAAPRVSGSRGARSPSTLGDLRTVLEKDLREWEYTVRKRDTRVRRGHLSSSLTACIDWLWSHFDVIIINTEISLPFGQEIRQWHRLLTYAGNAGSVRHTKPLPCPRPTCQRFRSLVWQEGTDYIECVSCHNLMKLDEYDDYAQLYPHLRDPVGALSHR
jgi:hypothetical protein